MHTFFELSHIVLGFQMPGCCLRGFVRGMIRIVLPASMAVLAAAPSGAAMSSNSLLSCSHDGVLIACSNRDSGSVTVFEAPGLKKRFETKVGLHPEGTVFVGDSSRVACCVYGTDQIVVLDGSSGRIIHTVDVFDEPYGIVSSSDGQYLYVTLEYPGQIIRISTATWQVDAEWRVGRMLRGIALSADQQNLFVTEYLTAGLLQVSTTDGSVLNTYSGTSTDNLARQVTLHPTRPKAFLPHVRSKVTAAHGNGSIFPYVSVATLAGESAGRRLRIPMDTFRGTRVVANPWEVAVAPDGRLAYTIFGGTNDLYVSTLR